MSVRMMAALCLVIGCGSPARPAVQPPAAPPDAATPAAPEPTVSIACDERPFGGTSTHHRLCTFPIPLASVHLVEGAEPPAIAIELDAPVSDPAMRGFALFTSGGVLCSGEHDPGTPEPAEPPCTITETPAADGTNGASHVTLTIPASAATPSVALEIKYSYCTSESCTNRSTVIATVTLPP